MLNIYYGPEPGPVTGGIDPRIFFDLNHTDYNFYTEQTCPEHVDIHVFNDHHFYNNSKSQAKWYLELEIFHSFENHVDSIYNQHRVIGTSSRQGRNHLVIILGIDPAINGEHLHYWDFHFNYTKALYSGFQFSPNTLLVYYNKHGFVLPKNFDANKKTAIFLAANNSYPNGKTKFYRPHLVDFLLKNYTDKGYIGDPHRARTLEFHAAQPNCNDIKRLEQNFKYDGRLWSTPIHNLYYEHTFISVYTETIEWGTTLVVSEKTYYPLIKGHFILPFSTNGFVDFLKHKGFKFPNFINYSYDSIVDADQRFSAYLEELKRLMSLDIDTWRNLWQDNLEIIKFNRQLFFDRDYSTVDLSQYS
jgi:hypothetical protein